MRRAVRARGGARASSRACGVNRLSASRPFRSGGGPARSGTKWAMAQQDKITTIDLMRAVLARNRAALALGISLAAVVLGISLAAVVLGTSPVLLVADHSSVTAVQADLAAERASMVTTIEAHAKQ